MRKIPVEPSTLCIAITHYLAVCDGPCIVYETVKNLCVDKGSPTQAVWAHTCKIFISNRPQRRKLYAMTMLCLFVRSFVRLSPTRTGRALAWLPISPIVLAAVIGRSAHGPLRPVVVRAYCTGHYRATLTCFYTVLLYYTTHGIYPVYTMQATQRKLADYYYYYYYLC